MVGDAIVNVDPILAAFSVRTSQPAEEIPGGYLGRYCYRRRIRIGEIHQCETWKAEVCWECAAFAFAANCIFPSSRGCSSDAQSNDAGFQTGG